MLSNLKSNRGVRLAQRAQRPEPCEGAGSLVAYGACAVQPR